VTTAGRKDHGGVLVDPDLDQALQVTQLQSQRVGTTTTIRMIIRTFIMDLYVETGPYCAKRRQNKVPVDYGAASGDALNGLLVSGTAGRRGNRAALGFQQEEFSRVHGAFSPGHHG
jgi:hypothetical protein